MSDSCVIVTDFSDFPGITFGGTFGLQRVGSGCIGYVTGWTYQESSSATDYIATAETGAKLPFPVGRSEPVRFTVPVPCNRPVTLDIFHSDDSSAGGSPCGCSTSYPPDANDTSCQVGQGQVATLNCTLSDDHTPPVVTATSVQDGEDAFDPLAAPSVTLSEPIDPNQPGIELLDPDGNGVAGRVILSADGLSATLVPDLRLKFDADYELRINPQDQGGNGGEPTTIHFHTFKPEVLRTIANIAANDIAYLDPSAWPEGSGVSACSDYIAVAEKGKEGHPPEPEL